MRTDLSRSRRNCPFAVPSDVSWRQAQLYFPLPLFVLSLVCSVTGRHESTFFQRPVIRSQKKLSRALGGSYYSLPKRKPKSSVSDHEEKGGEYNKGVYLDEETYLQAEGALLHADGSLNINKQRDTQSRSSMSDPSYTSITPALSGPPVQQIKNKMYQTVAKEIASPVPSYSYSNDGDNDSHTRTSEQQLSDEERLYETVMDIEGGTQTTNPEALHTQVFAEEQAFLQQSEKFRKSLSTDEETPMAQKRRESFVQGNEKVLGRLMTALDEMEEFALSRDEAMRQAGSSFPTANNKAKEIVCPKCGLRVTSDMLQRAEGMQATKGKNKSEKVPRPSAILCQSCYRQQLQTVNEARVRLGGGQFEGSTNTYNNKQWTGSKRYHNKRRNSAGGDRRGGGSSVQGINTSSLFDVPKGRETVPKTSNNVNEGRRNNKAGSDRNRGGSSVHDTTPSLSNVSKGYDSKRKKRTTPKTSMDTPPSRTSRRLGGMELTKRMQQQQSRTSGDKLKQTSYRTKGSLQLQKSEKTAFTMEGTEVEIDENVKLGDSPALGKSEETVGVNAIPFPNTVEEDVVNSQVNNEYSTSSPSDQWVKVEDSASNRMFYWNTETGEMKKTL